MNHLSVTRRIPFILFFASLIFLSCGDTSKGRIFTQQDNEALDSSASLGIRVDTLATGLKNPWGIAFLPDKRFLITEKEGNIRIFKDGSLQNEMIQGTPPVFSRGQGGLLDIALHPNFSSNNLVYFTYAKPGNGGATTTLARGRLQGNMLMNLQEIFMVDPYVSSNVHFGSRIAFDGKGYVFVSTGERGNKPNAQNLGNHNGTIVRLHDDGRVPADNPFVNTPNAKPEIWSYGHRNIQGMIFDTKGVLWAHEHGPKGGDEINIIEKGKNYGWPLVTHGIDYDGSVISKEKERDGLANPVHIWTPSIAPCGMTQVTSDRYKGWKGSFLVGALAGQHVARVEFNNKRVVKEEKLLNKIGRVRAVSQGPDGYIYVLTESPGMLLRIR
jgi:aldose sugar dehydrogenase